MRFGQLFEDDHDDLTHEVLTHHGFARQEGNSNGKVHHYRHSDPDNFKGAEDLHRDLKSIGWKKGEFQPPRSNTDGFDMGDTVYHSPGYKILSVADGHSPDGQQHFHSATLFPSGYA